MDSVGGNRAEVSAVERYRLYLRDVAEWYRDSIRYFLTGEGEPVAHLVPPHPARVTKGYWEKRQTEYDS